MIEVKINNVVKWQVNEYTFTDPQMGIRSINLTVKHPSMWVDGEAPLVADFSGAYVEYNGEIYTTSSTRPTVDKNNTNLDYTYTLVFKGEEEELTRRKIRNLATISPDTYVSQGTSFSLSTDIGGFSALIENNLQYYFGNKWTVNLSVAPSDVVQVDINNLFLWDLLQKMYELFGVRWNIRGNTINIGVEPDYIDHIFNYGYDGGLVKMTRSAPNEAIINRLSAVGGARNVPMNYFTDRYDKFPADPNPINKTVSIRNIMPKVFRDSVKTGTTPYIDYVEDTDSIADYGIREDALPPNEDIYPSIAGVTKSGLGRIDEIVHADPITESDPESSEYVPTFDIWIKDIGFDLSDNEYTATEQAVISFTTGALAGRDFVILAESDGTSADLKRKVVEDTSKTIAGVPSKYRITLIKSDEELDAYGLMLPNEAYELQSGDKFVILNIEMPHEYVLNAEQKLEDWMLDQLALVSKENPTYTIEPMDAFFEEVYMDLDGRTVAEKIVAGNKLTINNACVTGGAQELYINLVTIAYGKLITPKYTLTVTDRVEVDGGRVSRLESSIDALIDRQLFTRGEIDDLLGGISNKYISKIKPDGTNYNLNLRGGATFGRYMKGMIGGSGGKIDSYGRGEMESLSLRAFLEVPELRFNKISIYTGIRWDTFGGGLIESVEIDKDEFGNELQSGVATLKLEDGEYGAIGVDDLCQGIFHNFGGSNDTVNEDQRNGNFRFSGFNTSYFRITEILDGSNKTFRYVLRGVSERWDQQHHPKAQMNFACYANPTNTDRQSCTYTTTEYSIGLHNMTTWEYGEANIHSINGKLDGFQLGETVFEGSGSVIGNGYFYGSIQSIENAPYILELDNDGDNFLAFGESMTITCRLMKGFEDKTSEVEFWQVTRESGNQLEDTAWNIAHQNFNGQITLVHTKEYSDLGEGLSTLFRFVASSGNEIAIINLTV